MAPNASTSFFRPLVIELLDGHVPARRNEPTQTLQGREGIRSDRAKQVSAARKDATILFDEIANRMGYSGNHQPPRREILLKQGTKFLFFPFVTSCLTPGISTLGDSCGCAGTTNNDRDVTSWPTGGRRTGWTPLDGFYDFARCFTGCKLVC